ncbi:hypothetical protein ANCCAN_29566 [Ancylostoma caninum]|uniref:HAT C-terminal dimerisation domain-containing protein n=1 Tax=Ancylostoma caninum TaxID=29170 RepID=A0A368EY55_ANCCA|nr:hypothetical protein ANCCAN_29566 [Ancylostoma caninum]
MYDSLYFYEVLLNNTIALLVPNEVAQAIRCVLVIPASNADPERSFSAANRLSREERSNINTDTLDDLMTVQRDGPSLLSVKPEQLAYQWIHPQPALGLSPGKPSTFEKEGSIMKDVKTALSSGNVDELIALHVKRYMTLHGLSHRSDTEDIRRRLLQTERAKSTIFSIGSVHSLQQTPQQ